jgi:hypothetical protein
MKLRHSVDASRIYFTDYDTGLYCSLPLYFNRDIKEVVDEAVKNIQNQIDIRNALKLEIARQGLSPE